MTWDNEALRLMHACYRLARLRRHLRRVWGTSDRAVIAERRRAWHEHPITRAHDPLTRALNALDVAMGAPQPAPLPARPFVPGYPSMSADEFVKAQTNAYDPSKAFSATGLGNCVDSKLDDPITPGTKMTMEQWHLRYIR